MQGETGAGKIYLTNCKLDWLDRLPSNSHFFDYNLNFFVNSNLPFFDFFDEEIAKHCASLVCDSHGNRSVIGQRFPSKNGGSWRANDPFHSPSDLPFLITHSSVNCMNFLSKMYLCYSEIVWNPSFFFLNSLVMFLPMISIQSDLAIFI